MDRTLLSLSITESFRIRVISLSLSPSPPPPPPPPPRLQQRVHQVESLSTVTARLFYLKNEDEIIHFKSIDLNPFQRTPNHKQAGNQQQQQKQQNLAQSSGCNTVYTQRFLETSDRHLAPLVMQKLISSFGNAKISSTEEVFIQNILIREQA